MRETASNSDKQIKGWLSANRSRGLSYDVKT